MSSAKLFRLSGYILLAYVIVSVVSAIFGVVFIPDSSPDAPVSAIKSVFWSPSLYISFLGLLLYLMGLPGLYLRQAGKAGWLGLIGFLLIIVGSLMQVSLGSFFTEVLPLLAQKAPDLIGSGKTPPAIALMGLGGTVLNVLGTILLGSSVIRSKVFPRLTGILIIVAGVLSLVGGSGMGLIAGLVGVLSALLGAMAYGWIATLLLSSAKMGAMTANLPVQEILS